MWGKSHLCGQSLLHGHHETDNVTEMKSRWLKSFRYVRLSFQGMLRTRNRLWPIQIGAPSGFSFSDNPESSIWLEDNWHWLLPEPQWVGASGRSERQLSFSPSSARAPGASNCFHINCFWDYIDGEAHNSTYVLFSCLPLERATLRRLGWWRWRSWKENESRAMK